MPGTVNPRTLSIPGSLCVSGVTETMQPLVSVSMRTRSAHPFGNSARSASSFTSSDLAGRWRGQPERLPGKRVYRIEVAGNAPVGCHLHPARIDLAADLHDVRAARMEVAAAGRRQRGRHLALELGHDDLGLGIGHGRCIAKCAGVGVQRLVENRRYRAALDDAPQIHDRYRAAEMADDAEIMGDKDEAQ